MVKKENIYSLYSLGDWYPHDSISNFATGRIQTANKEIFQVDVYRYADSVHRIRNRFLHVNPVCQIF